MARGGGVPQSPQHPPLCKSVCKYHEILQTSKRDRKDNPYGQSRVPHLYPKEQAGGRAPPVRAHGAAGPLGPNPVAGPPPIQGAWGREPSQ